MAAWIVANCVALMPTLALASRAMTNAARDRT